MLKLKFNKKVLWSLVIFALVALGSIGALFKPGTDVNGVVVEKSAVEKFVEEEGVVRAVSNQKVYSKSGGEVETVYVLPGDQVERGDALASLVASEYELRVLAMESQKKALEKSLAELTRAKDDETLNIALGNVTASKNDQSNAFRNYENGKTLLAAGGISTTELNVLKMAYEQSVIHTKQAEEAYALLKKGPSKEVVDQTKAQIEALAYDIKRLMADKDSLMMISPVNGTVVEKLVDKGQYLLPGQQTFEIADLSKFYIEVELLVSDAYQIQKGSSVIISLEDTDISVKGKVDRVYPKAFSKISDLGVEQKRVRMDIVLDQDVVLLYGAEVSVKLIAEVKPSVLTIPDSAVFATMGKSYVFVVKDGVAILQEITVGLEGNEKIEVLSGLAEGQVVVDTPDSQLSDQEKVKVNLQAN